MDASTLEQLVKTEFHDATMADLSMSGGELRLPFEDVWLDDDCFNVTIRLGGVRDILRDGAPAAGVEAEGEWAGVIAFEKSEDSVSLILSWRSGVGSSEVTRAYTLKFETFGIEVERQDLAEVDNS